MAILYYVCVRNNRLDMLGKNSQDKILIKMLEEYLNDFFKDLTTLSFNENYNVEREKFFQFKVSQRLFTLTKYLGNNDYLLPYITYLDFFFYEFLNILEAMKEGCLEKYSVVHSYWKRFSGLPTVKSYLESIKFMKGPFWPPSLAKFH